MSRNRGENLVQVEQHRGNDICLNKVTSKFVVQQIATIEPQGTIGEARNAIDRHLNELNKGVRRKVLALGGRYYGGDEPRQLREGEITSWTRRRGYGGIEAVVMFGKDRENMNPGDVYEDTPENRAAIKRVQDLERQSHKARKDAKKIVEKELQCAVMPDHLKKENAE